jgi:hypothetical protein
LSGFKEVKGVKMKKLAVAIIAAATAGISHGAIFQFDLGPGGLNGLNERPLPVVTTATGGEIIGEPGISYNDVTKQLFVNFGWGNINGFTDLESNYAASHIHGPAGVEGAATVLYNFSGLVNQQTTTDGRPLVYQCPFQHIWRR